MSERPEGAEIVGIRRKRGKKGDIIAKGEYDRAKHIVQLTTRKLYEQCSDPGSDSIPGMCILQYRMHLTDAYSPTYSSRAVFNGSAGPSPHRRRHRRRPYTSMTTFSMFSAYSEVSAT